MLRFFSKCLFKSFRQLFSNLFFVLTQFFFNIGMDTRDLIDKRIYLNNFLRFFSFANLFIKFLREFLIIVVSLFAKLRWSVRSCWFLERRYFVQRCFWRFNISSRWLFWALIFLRCLRWLNHREYCEKLTTSQKEIRKIRTFGPNPTVIDHCRLDENLFDSISFGFGFGGHYS